MNARRWYHPIVILDRLGSESSLAQTHRCYATRMATDGPKATLGSNPKRACELAGIVTYGFLCRARLTTYALQRLVETRARLMNYAAVHQGHQNPDVMYFMRRNLEQIVLENDEVSLLALFD